MLSFPKGSSIYRIMSIDPGTNDLGLAIIDVDITTKEVSLVYATTLKPKSTNIQMVETFGDRKAKQENHRQNIEYLLNFYQPHCVISEAPYLGKFVDAFTALVEILQMLREVVANYDYCLKLETIEPNSVKNAVGAKGRNNDKDLIKQSIKALTKLVNKSLSSYDSLDQHAIDAIAVGCYKVKTLFGDII